MSKWVEKQKKPVLPLYFAALVWLVGALVLPPYRLSNLLILAGLSLAAYTVGSAGKTSASGQSKSLGPVCPKRVRNRS